MTLPVGATTPFITPDTGYHANALTPDALMTYLSTRLSGVDEQIQATFERQEVADEIRSAIGEIRTKLNAIPVNANKNERVPLEGDQLFEVQRIIEQDIAKLDPELSIRMLEKLKEEGFVLRGKETHYRTAQVENSLKYLDDVTKELESTAQMNMIWLQSLMSGRQTAISLSTNLIAKLTDSMQKVVENIR